jgi:hypothetical protein
MRTLGVAVLAAALLAVTSAASGATSKNACTLVTAADAAKALGAGVGKGAHGKLGLYDSCTYTTKASGSKTVTVQTRPIATKSAFVKSAKATGQIVAVPGIGTAAYSAGNGSSLLVWKKGTEVTFLVFGVKSASAQPVMRQLAKTAVSRI